MRRHVRRQVLAVGRTVRLYTGTKPSPFSAADLRVLELLSGKLEVFCSLGHKGCLDICPCLYAGVCTVTCIHTSVRACEQPCVQPCVKAWAQVHTSAAPVKLKSRESRGPRPHGTRVAIELCFGSAAPSASAIDGRRASTTIKPRRPPVEVEMKERKPSADAEGTAVIVAMESAVVGKSWSDVDGVVGKNVLYLTSGAIKGSDVLNIRKRMATPMTTPMAEAALQRLAGIEVWACRYGWACCQDDCCTDCCCDCGTARCKYPLALRDWSVQRLLSCRLIGDWLFGLAVWADGTSVLSPLPLSPYSPRPTGCFTDPPTLTIHTAVRFQAIDDTRPVAWWHDVSSRFGPRR